MISSSTSSKIFQNIFQMHNTHMVDASWFVVATTIFKKIFKIVPGVFVSHIKYLNKAKDFAIPCKDFIYLKYFLYLTTEC